MFHLRIPKVSHPILVLRAERLIHWGKSVESALRSDQCGHRVATSNISLSALGEKWVGGGEGSKSRGPTKSTIWFTDEESLGWATASPQHRRNQASFRKWKSQRGSQAVILFIYFSLNCLPETQITPVSDSTAKLCVFFIGCYRDAFRSRMWFMWIQMIPKLSYPLWFIYEIHQTFRVTGGNLGERLPSAAEDIRRQRLLQFHKRAGVCCENKGDFFFIIIILLSSHQVL